MRRGSAFGLQSFTAKGAELDGELEVEEHVEAILYRLVDGGGAERDGGNEGERYAGHDERRHGQRDRSVSLEPPMVVGEGDDVEGDDHT